jgi:cytochrome c-type biogenesis protein CcmH/NrfG
METAAPKQLEEQVWEALKRGDAKRAISICEALNRQFPEFESGWHTASQLALKLGNAQMALDAIREALRMRPDHTPWMIQEGRCLARLGRIEDFANIVDRLSDTRINSPYELSALGMLLTQLGRREDALARYQEAAKLQPSDARHYYNIASLQRTLGRLEDAERNFSKTISLNPQDFEAYKLRSELRTQTTESNHVAELEAALEHGIGGRRGKAHLCYALAKELEDMGIDERSFEWLKEGADVRRSLMDYNADRDVETINTIREVFTPNVFAAPESGAQSREPIFVLGMPRTGTTLLERILASHTEIQSAGELSDFALELMKLVRAEAGAQKVSRDELVRLSTGIDFARLGDEYVRSTRPFTGQTRHFIDKLPLNYLYVGLIHLALPNATIINVRRNPLDTCYAVYKTLFADAYPFSYDLGELARYYVAYHELMEHWNTVLPGKMYRIDYEALVTDTETTSRQLVEHCGLEWQPQCLKFHENSAASTTASAVQIRKPVYRSSVGRWRRFRQQLEPVIDILGEAGIVDANGDPCE